ncbi:MAG: hypothetical protein MZU91_07945 [Desulfosudis oleivorans]|nr:hypothetical protein [Desulfosudis oleivorans]
MDGDRPRGWMLTPKCGTDGGMRKIALFGVSACLLGVALCCPRPPRKPRRCCSPAPSEDEDPVAVHHRLVGRRRSPRRKRRAGRGARHPRRAITSWPTRAS